MTAFVVAFVTTDSTAGDGAAAAALVLRQPATRIYFVTFQSLTANNETASRTKLRCPSTSSPNYYSLNTQSFDVI